MSNIAKISVEKHENNEQFLYDLDKNLPLNKIVQDVCKKGGLVSFIFIYLCLNNYRTYIDIIIIIF